MARGWYAELTDKHDSLPGPTTPSRSTRFWDRSGLILTRLFAVIGLLLILERITSFYVLNISDSAVSPLLHRPLHPIDAALDYSVNNTGHDLHVDGAYGKKAIIVASTKKEDTQWVHDNFPDWEVNAYVVDDLSANLTVFKNKGREAAVYLTYIINNYYHLPDYMVFLHADRYQWHNEDPMYDGVPPVLNLRLSHVKSVGYASLRCTWFPGCPTSQHPSLSSPDKNRGISHTYALQWQSFFPHSPLPPSVGAPCCGQFAVTRERVLERSVTEYERIRQWLWETALGDGRSGRVMEYMWHKLFGMEAVHCPDAETCFCEKFGLCGLSCPSEGACLGRYKLPPWTKPIPKGWPQHGQGTSGYPKWGWWQKFYPGEEFGLGYAKEDLGPLIDGTEIKPKPLSDGVTNNHPNETVKAAIEVAAEEGLVPIEEFENAMDEAIAETKGVRDDDNDGLVAPVR